jgi:hypothetical protein
LSCAGCEAFEAISGALKKAISGALKTTISGALKKATNGAFLKDSKQALSKCFASRSGMGGWPLATTFKIKAGSNIDTITFLNVESHIRLQLTHLYCFLGRIATTTRVF